MEVTEKTRRNAKGLLRVSFDATQDLRDQMGRLAEDSGAGTMRNTIRDAINVYSILVKHYRRGGHIYLNDNRLLLPGVPTDDRDI